MASWVYIMASGPFGTLYTGVTANLIKRAWQHRESETEGSTFCKKYGVNRLFSFEQFEGIENPIHREKRIKKWPRRWKTRLVEQMNPQWQRFCRRKSRYR